MAINTTYKVTKGTPESLLSLNRINDQDLPLVQRLELDTVFKPSQNRLDVFFYSLDGRYLSSKIDSRTYSVVQGGSRNAGQIEDITLNPEKDSIDAGYPNGDVNVLYNFVNNLLTVNNTQPKLFIESISPDRTEIRALTNDVSRKNIVRFVDTIKGRLNDTSYFEDFRLNFGRNQLLIGINIDRVDFNDSQAIIIKLYEPLPAGIDVKDTFLLEELVGDSVLYQVATEVSRIAVEDQFNLRGPNYDIELVEENNNPTGYLNYDELFSYPVTNSYYEVYSLFNEKGAQISLDHTDFNEFIQFSSAEERLKNFYYKASLLESYRNQINARNTYTGSLVENIKGIVSNFDHYDRYLYYETGSRAWPKSTSTRPYTLYSTGSTQVQDWYTNILLSASDYDASNQDRLINAIPSFVREDSNNAPYSLFTDMIGQHFDNLWIYSKAVTDKFDADNRLEFGISKDLVRDAIENFGIKLYNNNEALENLFAAFTGETYSTGSESTVTSLIVAVEGSGSLSGSVGNEHLQPMPKSSYQKEVYKRIYHNIPLLLKSKGTERGLRALINSFGIPYDILDIRTFGGAENTASTFYGPSTDFTSSLDKIRISNTDTVVSGSTLSSYTSVIQPGKDYSTDLHTVEIGFSPGNSLDNFIKSHPSMSTFNLDEYIGDPGAIYSSSYSSLNSLAETVFTSGSSYANPYNAKEFVRLIKFFDNSLFRMVKEFLPARSNVSTGIVIKPHLLNRSKIKQPQVGWSNQTSPGFIHSGTQLDYTGSYYSTNFSIDGEIDTAFISGSTGLNNNYTSSYTETYANPSGGYQTLTRNNHDQAAYTGELSGTIIQASNGDLAASNPFRKLNANKEFTFAYLPSSDFSSLEGFLANETAANYISSTLSTSFENGQSILDVTSFSLNTENEVRFRLTGRADNVDQTTAQSASALLRFDSNIADGSQVEVDVVVSWNGIFGTGNGNFFVGNGESIGDPKPEQGVVVVELVSGSTVVDSTEIFADFQDFIYGSQGSGGQFSDQYGLPPYTRTLTFINNSGATINSTDWYINTKYSSFLYRPESGEDQQETFATVNVSPIVGVFNNDAITLWVSGSFFEGANQNLIKGFTIPINSPTNGYTEPYIKEATELVFQYEKYVKGTQQYDSSLILKEVEGGQTYRVNDIITDDIITLVHVEDAPTVGTFSHVIDDLNDGDIALYNFTHQFLDYPSKYLNINTEPASNYPTYTTGLRRNIRDASGVVTIYDPGEPPSQTADTNRHYVNFDGLDGSFTAQYSRSIAETVFENDLISFNYTVSFPGLGGLQSYGASDGNGIIVSGSIRDTSGNIVGNVSPGIQHTAQGQIFNVSASFTASQDYNSGDLDFYIETFAQELVDALSSNINHVEIEPINVGITTTLVTSSRTQDLTVNYIDSEKLSYTNNTGITLSPVEFFYKIDVPKSDVRNKPRFQLRYPEIRYNFQQVDYYNSKIKSKKKLGNAYSIEFEDTIYIPSASVELGVTSSLFKQGFIPGTTQKFLNNSYAATSNNVDSLRRSNTRLILDEQTYTPTQGNYVGTFLPANYSVLLGAINNGVEGLNERLFAEVQDSNYYATGWRNGRYDGTETTNRRRGARVLGLEPSVNFDSFTGYRFLDTATTASIRDLVASVGDAAGEERQDLTIYYNKYESKLIGQVLTEVTNPSGSVSNDATSYTAFDSITTTGFNVNVTGSAYSYTYSGSIGDLTDGGRVEVDFDITYQYFTDTEISSSTWLPDLRLSGIVNGTRQQIGSNNLNYSDGTFVSKVGPADTYNYKADILSDSVATDVILTWSPITFNPLPSPDNTNPNQTDIIMSLNTIKKSAFIPVNNPTSGILAETEEVKTFFYEEVTPTPSSPNGFQTITNSKIYRLDTDEILTTNDLGIVTNIE